MHHPSELPFTLLDLIGNSLILRQLAPYLPLASTLSLAATSHSFRDLLYHDLEAFRYLDLSTVKSAILAYAPIDTGGISWRSQRMDEALSVDEFYFGPLRGIFSNLGRMNVVNYVQTLILDGLNVPADLIQDIISQDRYNVRILSLREANINERQLMQVLNYVVRPTRPEGTPKLRGLYIFGARDRVVPSQKAVGAARNGKSKEISLEGDVMSSEGAQIGARWNERSQNALKGREATLNLCDDPWYKASGRMFKKPPLSGWADTLKACEDIIAFDAVLCRGPRHDPNNITTQHSCAGSHVPTWLPSAIATVALGPNGCTKCGSSTEGAGLFGKSPTWHIPLLAPPPLHSSSLYAAQRPSGSTGSTPPPFIARCEDCLRARWCERCLKWWDEDCYSPPANGTRLSEVSDGDVTSVKYPLDEGSRKIYMGLCTEYCLVSEMMSGAGSNGMWG